jgi:predicted ATPase/DNA-binding CsgD family transcriptional regulator/DNA-binding XRE family transcriptional regulator
MLAGLQAEAKMATTSRFGVLLQRYRLAAGLSQEALAEQAGLSRRGISDLERGQRRSPHPATVRRLADALRLADPERAALLADLRTSIESQAKEPTRAPSNARRLANLSPDLTSFVGRETELARLIDRLPSVRLLTLVGPGGVGKTRLAMRLAARLVDRYGDGACLVDLAKLSDARVVPNVVASALGITERGRTPLAMTLLDTLREQELLLVLDNCEHVLDGCADLAHAVAGSCPSVTVLATSREPLRISGEVTWPVLPLSLAATTAANGAAPEAVQLFVERARAVEPRFELTPQNRDAITDICRWLDGLPLAIELAAARVRSMPVRGLLHHLQLTPGGLPLLTGGPRDAPVRQQTLRATIAWSYELLSADEQVLFRRLAPFRGCTLEAVDAVCIALPREPGATTLMLPSLNVDVRAGLESLVNKSLLRVDEDEQGQPWYVMLETVGEFAQEQLETSGEAQAVWRRHIWYYLQLAEQSTPAPRSLRQDQFMLRLERELGNFRAALDWCQSHGYAEASLRLALALVWFWGVHGHISEGRSWLEALVDRFPLRTMQGPRAAVYASALQAIGRLATLQRDFAAASARQQESLKLSEALEDQTRMCDALYGLAFAAQEQGQYSAARRYLERGLALSQARAEMTEITDDKTLYRLGQGLHALAVLAHEDGDTDSALALLQQSTTYLKRLGHPVHLALNDIELAVMVGECGDFDRARELIERSVVVLERNDDRRSVGIALAHLADVAIAQSDWSTAYRHLCRSLRTHHELGELPGIAFVLVRFAHLASAQGQAARALRLSGAAERLRQLAEAVLTPLVQRRLDEQLAPARQALGPNAEEALRDGRALSLEAAISEALTTYPFESRHGGGTFTDPLSPREREVATLIGRGYSNRRVAEALVIGEATVATHVQHILAKLELGSRAQIAAWATERRLLGQTTGDEARS